MPLSAAMVRMRSPVVGSRSDAAVRTFEGANARLLAGAAISAGVSGRMGSPERAGGLEGGGRGSGPGWRRMVLPHAGHLHASSGTAGGLHGLIPRRYEREAAPREG